MRCDPQVNPIAFRMAFFWKGFARVKRGNIERLYARKLQMHATISNGRAYATCFAIEVEIINGSTILWRGAEKA